MVADSLRVLESILEFPLQCNQVLWEISQINLPGQCFLAENIVISGMGGSALGGRIISGLERQILKVPIVVSTEFHLPNFVDNGSLVIVSSYSGNTRETIHSIAEARARDAQIFIICSGGELAEIAVNQNIPHYIFQPRHNPSGQPRLGLGYNVMSIISILARCHLIHPLPDLSKLKQYLQDEVTDLKPFSDLALQFKDKIPVLVSSEHLKGAAHAFKNQLNETGKSFSASFDIPELNHHLMEGLTFPGSNKLNLRFLLIESGHYHPELKKLYKITADVIQKNHIPFSILPVKSPNRFFDAMSLIQSGALVSFYLSQIYDIDPGPVPWVDYFKESL